MNLPIRPVAHTPRKDDPEQRWHYLDDHLKAVATLASQFGADFDVEGLAYSSGLWHDLGKYNAAFQNYLQACFAADKLGKPKPAKSVRHAVHGAILAMESLEPLAFLIAGHHSGMPGKSKLKSSVNNPVSIEQTRFCKDAAKAAEFDLSVPQSLGRELETLPQNPASFELLLRFIFSSLVDADFLDTEAHFDPKAQLGIVRLTLASHHKDSRS